MISTYVAQSLGAEFGDGPVDQPFWTRETSAVLVGIRLFTLRWKNGDPSAETKVYIDSIAAENLELARPAGDELQVWGITDGAATRTLYFVHEKNGIQSDATALVINNVAEA